MCGIVAVYGSTNVVHDIYESLTVLQHRGQDASGILTNHEGKITLRKSLGLVRDGFNHKHINRLKGNLGIGHVRYPTAGHADNSAEAQPFYVNSPYGIVLVHNGNLVNTESLSKELFKEDLRHLNTTSDSEVLLNIFAHALQKRGHTKLTRDDIFSAVDELHNRVQGAYAVIIMILGYGILAFRDPYGIRPLIYGSKSTTQHMFSSESVALDCLNYSRKMRDVEPGESMFIDFNGKVHTHRYKEAKSKTPCIFEYVYLARPDSTMDKINVYNSRLSMGKYLAKKIKNTLTETELKEIDVVIPIPDTSRTSALPISVELKKELREGFVKNRYIGRTFIMPGQKIRKKSVKQKLNTINMEFKGRFGRNSFSIQPDIQIFAQALIIFTGIERDRDSVPLYITRDFSPLVIFKIPGLKICFQPKCLCGVIIGLLGS